MAQPAIQPKPFIPPTVWRIGESELDKIAVWLIPSLKKDWPRLSEDGVRFWFKSAISDRRTLFVRTTNTVGMAHVHTDVLEPTPVVIEKFVRGNKKAESEEYVLLYQAIKDWARVIGAKQFSFDHDSDAGMQNHIVPGLQTFETPVSRMPVYICRLKDTD